jgi:hypothetical protein
MRLLAVLLLVACDQPRPQRATAADETPLGRGPRPTGSADLDAMTDFVRVVDVDVPTKPAALQAWLIGGSYRSWPHESAQHPSSGPHAEGVITFLSPALDGSLRAKAKSHPQGAAAVKELFKAGKHVGWAVSVKTAVDSASGKNWYWYEILSTAPRAKAAYEGRGVLICRDCHSESGGVDQVLIDEHLAARAEFDRLRRIVGAETGGRCEREECEAEGVSWGHGFSWNRGRPGGRAVAGRGELPTSGRTPGPAGLAAGRARSREVTTRSSRRPRPGSARS